MSYHNPGLYQVTGPTVEPLTLTEVKKHLELVSADTTHDDQLYALIARARDQFQHDTQCSLMRSTWRETYTNWDDDFDLGMRPLVSVTSIKYYDGLGSQQTVSSSLYDVDTARNEVRLKHLQTWPSHDGREYGIEITYVAGFATSADQIPPMAKQAMLLLVGQYFAGRGDEPAAPPSAIAYENLIRRMMRASYP